MITVLHGGTAKSEVDLIVKVDAIVEETVVVRVINFELGLNWIKFEFPLK